MRFLILFVLWCILFVLCWPVAVLSLILFPLVWLLALPFRLLAIVVRAFLALLTAVLLLPSRLLSWKGGCRI
jgi:hypothetical protein